jgi:chromosomal replication initiator protein
MKISPYVFAGLSNTHETAPDKIKSLICEYFKITIDDFESKKRYQELVGARNWFAFIQKNFYNKTFKQIGRECGGRDHSTTIHSINTLKGELSIYPELRREFKTFLRSVNYSWENKFEKIIAEKF